LNILCHKNNLIFLLICHGIITGDLKPSFSPNRTISVPTIDRTPGRYDETQSSSSTIAEGEILGRLSTRYLNDGYI
jgi:hypothetical protein